MNGLPIFQAASGGGVGVSAFPSSVRPVFHNLIRVQILRCRGSGEGMDDTTYYAAV